MYIATSILYKEMPAPFQRYIFISTMTKVLRAQGGWRHSGNGGKGGGRSSGECG